MMVPKLLFIYLMILFCGLLTAQSVETAETLQQIASDSLSLAREKEILSEYGFRDTNKLGEVAEMLEISNINSWKRFLGLEPQNKKLDAMTLRKLGITPYRALLAQQFSVYGFTELSTLAEVSASLNMPIKKLKQMLSLTDPNSRKWDNNSLQSLDISTEDIMKLWGEFSENSLAYGLNVTLVGMLTVFAALLITSIVIGQLIHLNRPPKKASPDLKLSPGGKVIAASATLNRSVIVAIIAALHIHQQSTEERKRMALTFRRTPTNQWRASAFLRMPNREINITRK